MCSLWLVTVAVVLASMLPSSAALSVCNVTECSGRGGECTLYTCKIGWKDIGKYCDKTINGIRNACPLSGEQCGDGLCTYEFPFYSVCVNNVCRLDKDQQCELADQDGGSCSLFGFDGTCSRGFCFVSCGKDLKCGGFPCIGGYCAAPKCEESFCSK